jgi:general secretion pathway protein D
MVLFHKFACPDRAFNGYFAGRNRFDPSPGFNSIGTHTNTNTVYRLFSVAVSILAVVRIASSQVAPEQPNQFPALQIANPPSTDPATSPARASEMVRLQFPNSDVADVLHLYEQLTGKKLVMDNFVQGKVNIFIAKDVPRDEAIKIIEMSLALNGISLIPAGRDIVEVVGAGQNPRKAAVPIISDLAEIPAGNPVISFLFRLQYADPQELQQVLMAYFQGSSGSINILALPKSSSLLVTQNADIIRQLASVIQQVDVAPAEVVSEFIKLERADASKVCDMLKDIFEKGGEKTGQPGVRSVRAAPPVPQPVAVEGEGGGLGGLSEQSIIVGKIKLTADVRTNRIHVVTRPINMPFVRQLIHEFDANVEFAKPVTRPLKYISAGDVLPVLVQALTEPGAAQPGAEAGGGTPAPQATPYRVTTATAGGGVAASSYTGGAATGGESTLNISEELSTQPVDTVPKAVTVGNAKLIADQRGNAIIVLGSREVVVKVEKILDEMDVKAPQVALSTVIGQLTLNNNEEFGADYFAKYNRKFVGTSNNLNQQTQVAIPVPSAAPSASPIINNGIVDPSNLINFSQIIQNVGSGTNIYVAAGNAFAAIVHLLESTNKFKILSRPTVFTSNNKKAIIASGQEVPVPVSTLSNVGTTTITGTAAVQASIEYKKVVLQLEVVPLINSEKEISLDILQKIDSVVPNGQVNIGGNEVPTIDTKYLRTNVSAANGSTIILGGLMQEQKQKQYSGIPYLSRIPLIGAAFRGTTSTKQRQELIILMCPQVTLTKLEAFRLRQRYENTTHFGADLDENDCPDCPKTQEGKQLMLPPPDIPEPKDMK